MRELERRIVALERSATEKGDHTMVVYNLATGAAWSWRDGKVCPVDEPTQPLRIAAKVQPGYMEMLLP